MKIYDIIMAAADHIERHPDEFLFTSSTFLPERGAAYPDAHWVGSDAWRVLHDEHTTAHRYFRL